MSDTAIDRQGPHPMLVTLRAIRLWWHKKTSMTVDQEKVVAKLSEETDLSPRYLFMTAMSAGIAVLGLLLSSPAVVIGAMLLSPLMGPILGAGFALAIGDARWLRTCVKSLLVGTLIAVLFCAFIVLVSPLQTVTDEIIARTRPNLFDLAVALFSALAGSYAMIRGREGTIVGVAIATALMPPLAVVGYGLATGSWRIFGGSLMLFVTNLLTIALTAALMARYYGFRSRLSSRQTAMQSAAIVASFIVLAIPLGASLRQIAWEANASRQARAFILDQFDARARLSQLDIDFGTEPIAIAATVLTPEFRPEAMPQVRRVLERTFEQQVKLSIEQFRVGTDPGAAEAAQLAAARAREQNAATERQIAGIGQSLALVAGVSEDEVLIDPDRRHASVRARPIAGTSLAGYRDLESRIAGRVDGWRIALIPPLRPLPPIAFAPDGNPTSEGTVAISLIAWAGRRTALPIALSGPEEQVASVRQVLAQAGVETMAAQDRATAAPGGDGESVRATWSLPPIE